MYEFNLRILKCLFVIAKIKIYKKADKVYVHLQISKWELITNSFSVIVVMTSQPANQAGPEALRNR
jgi:hypothetical protein